MAIKLFYWQKIKTAYHNLAKMSSIAFTDGFYYVPRIDKKIIEKYKEDIMVLSGSLYGEIPNKLFKYWREASRGSVGLVEKNIWRRFLRGSIKAPARR